MRTILGLMIVGTAAAAGVDAPEVRFPLAMKKRWTVLNDAVCYANALAAVDYTDEIQPAADTAGLRVVGCFPATLDNAADGLESEVEQTIRRYANSTTYPIPRSAIGLNAYVEDDKTVAGFSTNLVPAGIVYDVDSNGIWVDSRNLALALAWSRRPCKRVAKTDDYTVTAAIAFEGRTWFDCDKASIMEITLPSAVAGMKVGVHRLAATAAHDVTIQAATGDTIEASDATCAAGKQIDNTYDAIGLGILWLEAQDDTAWKVVPPMPPDFAQAWVKNDA